MTGFAGVAPLSGVMPSEGLERRFRAMTARIAAFGDEFERLSCGNAVLSIVRPPFHPDLVRVDRTEGAVRIVQARKLRIVGIADDEGDDAGRLLRAWDRWGEGGFSRVEGDFLFLEWDAKRSQLTCARAPLTEIALFLSVRDGAVEWASVAPALGEGRAPDLDSMAAQYSGHSIFGLRGTAFKGVWAPPPGVITTVDRDGTHERRFWDPVDEDDSPLDDHVAAEALRAALDEAVGESLDDAGPVVASHLSAGRDSSAVNALAARRLAIEGRRLQAYTAVPISGYEGLPGRYLADEGPAAAQFAAEFSAITHHRVSIPDIQLGALLDAWNWHSTLGHGNVVGLIWWQRIFAQAQAAGVNTLLSGGLGNFTISAGGPWAIPDVLASGRLRLWHRRLREASEHPDASTKNLLASSLLVLLPPLVGASIHRHRRARHGSQVSSLPPFFRGDLAEASRRLHARGGWKEPLLNRTLVLETLRSADLGDPRPWLHHGIVLRDPTADRRVVRVSLRLSAAQLAAPYDKRPLYERAFRGVVPEATLQQPRRGQQGADWNQAIDVADLRAAVRRYGEHAMVRDLIDIDSLLGALALWPGGICLDGPIYMALVVRALPAIALASFISLHFPG